MLRLLIVGTRRDAEAAARRHGVRHIGFEAPLGDEGAVGEHTAGVADDAHLEAVERWFNEEDEPKPGLGFKPGTLLWFKNQPKGRPAPPMVDLSGGGGGAGAPR